MKKYFIVIAIIFLATVLFFAWRETAHAPKSAAGTVAQPGVRVYTSQDDHFSVAYSSDWMVDTSATSGHEVIFTTEPGGMGVAGVSVEPFAGTLDDFVRTYHPNLAVDVDAYATSTSAFVMVDGQRAVQYHFSYPYRPEVQTFVVSGGNLYTIFADRADADSGAMLASFRLIK